MPLALAYFFQTLRLADRQGRPFAKLDLSHTCGYLPANQSAYLRHLFMYRQIPVYVLFGGVKWRIFIKILVCWTKTTAKRYSHIYNLPCIRNLNWRFQVKNGVSRNHGAQVPSPLYLTTITWKYQRPTLSYNKGLFYFWFSNLVTSVPICGNISTANSSDSLRYSLGENEIPTPAGVPVKMIVPGCKVVPCDKNETIWGTEKIRSL